MNKKDREGKAIHIWLEEDQHELLRSIAHSQFRTIKGCVEMLTREYIKAHTQEL